MKAILLISFYFSLAYFSAAIIAVLIYFFNVKRKVDSEQRGNGSDDYNKDYREYK